MFRLLFLAITQAVLLCATQSFFKIAADKMGPFSWTWAFFRDSLITNWWLLLWGACGISAMVEWVYMLKHYPFSQVYPLSSLGYLFGIIVAALFFHETIAWTQWVGVVLILAGCYFIAQ